MNAESNTHFPDALCALAFSERAFLRGIVLSYFSLVNFNPFYPYKFLNFLAQKVDSDHVIQENFGDRRFMRFGPGFLPKVKKSREKTKN